MRKMFIGILALLLVGCAEYKESRELSKYVNDNWGVELSKFSVRRLEICSSGLGGHSIRAAIQEGGCNILNKHYHFGISGTARSMFMGLVLEKNNGKWLAHSYNDIERKISFESAGRIIDWILTHYVDAKSKETTILSSWER